MGLVEQVSGCVKPICEHILNRTYTHTRVINILELSNTVKKERKEKKGRNKRYAQELNIRAE